AAAQRHLAGLAGRPRDADARPEVGEVGQVRLRLVADARAHRQVPADADVVLDVRARLQVPVVDVGIAGALREAARTLRQVGVAALAGVGAEVVGRGV